MLVLMGINIEQANSSQHALYLTNLSYLFNHSFPVIVKLDIMVFQGLKAFMSDEAAIFSRIYIIIVNVFVKKDSQVF
jgi:hypothetical protein